MEKRKDMGKGLFLKAANYLKTHRKTEYAVYAVIAVIIIVIYLSSLLPEKEAPSPLFGSAGKDQQEQSDQIEERLQSILSHIRGVGEVEVMITYASGTEKLLPVLGAIVVAEGADDFIVKNDLLTAVKTVLDIPVSRIEVFERESFIDR